MIEDFTFPIVISRHHNENIFEESSDGKCPDDKRKHAKNLLIIFFEF